MLRRRSKEEKLLLLVDTKTNVNSIKWNVDDVNGDSRTRTDDENCRCARAQGAQYGAQPTQGSLLFFVDLVTRQTKKHE